MKKNKIEWNLNDLYKEGEFEKQYLAVENKLPQIKAYSDKLTPDMPLEDFKAMLEFDEKLSNEVSKLYARPSLAECINQNDATSKMQKDKVTDLSLQIAELSEKIDQWLKGKEVEGKKTLDDANATRLFSAIPDLEYSLKYARMAAKYTLSEKEENILSNTSASGEGVLTDLRTQFETEFTFKFKPEASTKTKVIKNKSDLVKYVYSANATDRNSAYHVLLTKYKENILKFFMIYQGIVKRSVYETKIRGYNSPISVRNFGNQIPDVAIEVLLDTCSRNVDIFQRYFRFKAKELGMEKLRRCDIYAPLNKKEDEISYNEAIKLTLEAFSNFSTQFAENAKKIISDKHVHVFPQQNKQSGAFCWTVAPDLSPYVLMNFTGTTREIETLAHELGHGVHSIYANKHYPSTQHANLPLAETASTFGEMLLFDNLLSKTTDPLVKKSMLSDKISESYATIIRQCYFVKFEIKAHEEIQKGITAEQLSALWLDTLKEQFGDAVEVDELFRYEWAYIPHLVNTPFYCYSYCFGELLTMSLYAEYKKQGKSFVEKIEKILSAGGAYDPVKVLEEVGIAITSADFWQKSFDPIRAWQQQLEEL